MPRLSPFRIALPLLMSLGLSGCITYVNAPTPEPAPAPPTSDAGTETNEAAAPKAPLLPSTLFPGEADELVGWRCTPAQDLITAEGEDELRLWSALGANRLEPAVQRQPLPARGAERLVEG